MRWWAQRGAEAYSWWHRREEKALGLGNSVSGPRHLPHSAPLPQVQRCWCWYPSIKGATSLMLMVSIRTMRVCVYKFSESWVIFSGIKSHPREPLILVRTEILSSDCIFLKACHFPIYMKTSENGPISVLRFWDPKGRIVCLSSDPELMSTEEPVHDYSHSLFLSVLMTSKPGVRIMCIRAPGD